MAYSREIAIDNRKKKWREQLEQLNKSLVDIKPQENESDEIQNTWKSWHDTAKKLDRRISVYSAHDGYAYVSITNTFERLHKYIRTRTLYLKKIAQEQKEAERAERINAEIKEANKVEAPPAPVTNANNPSCVLVAFFQPAPGMTSVPIARVVKVERPSK